MRLIEQIDARVDGARGVRAGERDLLADDGREGRVEGEHELLDLSLLRVAQRS